MSAIGGRKRSIWARVAGVLIPVMSLAAVLLFAFWESEESTSPGPLHPSHADVKELDGTDNCDACHGEQDTVMDTACVVCHDEIKDQQDRASGIHGKLDKSKEFECRSCHTDHTGSAVGLVAPRSFELAGTSGAADFDHARFAPFALTGKHAQLACVECHPNALALALKQGQLRFLGLSQACTACHRDVHEGRLGPDCETCHGQEQPFKDAPGFQHSAVFPLAGGHAGLACADCHAQDGATSVASLIAAPGGPVRVCAACHASPHRTEFISRMATIAGKAEEDACALCHDAAQETFLGPQATLTAEQHAATGFVLEAPHAGLDCVRCHEQYGKREPLSKEGNLDVQFAALYPGRSPKECGLCHEDPHKGAFESRFACIECHAGTQWAPSVFDAEMHGRTQFALTGGHRKVACSRCHDPARGLEQFAATPTACAACHEDVHNGQFDRAGRPEEIRGLAGCARCHDTESFKAVRWNSDDHRVWTGYALDGAHAETACAQCHPRAATYAKTFGGASRECAACHADPHRGVFDAPSLAKEVAGKTGCARCHDNTDFGAVKWAAAEHATWTGYALEGAHLKLECIQCHKPTAETGISNRTVGFAERDCATCHADPHAGQFAAEGRTDCSRCHAVEEDFRRYTFDHQKGARFALDETHGKLDCGVCHQPFKLETGRMAIRYKPLGVQCQDCHNFPTATGARLQ